MHRNNDRYVWFSDGQNCSLPIGCDTDFECLDICILLNCKSSDLMKEDEESFAKNNPLPFKLDHSDCRLNHIAGAFRWTSHQTQICRLLQPHKLKSTLHIILRWIVIYVSHQSRGNRPPLYRCVGRNGRMGQRRRANRSVAGSGMGFLYRCSRLSLCVRCHCVGWGRQLAAPNRVDDWFQRNA